MTFQHALRVTALAAVVSALTAPALAQAPKDAPPMPGHGMGMNGMGPGMMSSGMMGGRMMHMMSGCAGMMQSMNDIRPNSQWQKHPSANRSMPN